MTQPRTIVFLGKSGSGKDTQAKIVAEKLKPALYVSTGAFFREAMNKDTAMGRRTKEVMDNGELMPHWFGALAWEQTLLEKLKDKENIIFPSSPRNPEEAEELDEVLEWLGRDLSEAVLVDVPDEEVIKRLLKRARFDDNEKDIRARLAWFELHVGPTIDYYEKAGRLHRVDGVGSIEEIKERIAKALGI